MILNLVHDNMK